MRTREVAEICGVTEECIRQNAKKVGIEVGDRWNPHDWTEDELKKIQTILLRNQTTRGNMTTNTVSNINQVNLGVGLSLKIKDFYTTLNNITRRNKKMNIYEFIERTGMQVSTTDLRKYENEELDFDTWFEILGE